MIWYEIKKIFLRPSCQIALILLLLLAGRFCIQVMNGTERAYWVAEDGQPETGVAAMQKLRAAQKEWSGLLDQDLLRKALSTLKQLQQEGSNHPEDVDYAYKRSQGLMPIRFLLNNAFKSGYQWKYEDYYLAETLEEDQLPDFYENRIRQLKDWLYEKTSPGYAHFSEEEKQYLVRNYEALQTPFVMDYTTGWDMAYRISYYIIVYGSILASFLVSGIFANEFRWKTDSVYFSTELGRKKCTLAKLSAGFLVTTLVYWGILLAANLLVLGCMGFDGADCPIQIDKQFWNSIYNVTFLQRSLLTLADGYVLWMFLTALVMLVSAAFRSVSLAVSIPSVLMLGASLLERRGYVDFAFKISMLFPHKIAELDYSCRNLVLYSIFGRVVQPITVQRILYPGLTIGMAVVCYAVFRRKQIR